MIYYLSLSEEKFTCHSPPLRCFMSQYLESFYANETKHVLMKHLKWQIKQNKTTKWTSPYSSQCVKTSKIFSKNQIKNALFPMEMKIGCITLKINTTMDTSSCQISVEQWQPLINRRIRDIWVISHKKQFQEKFKQTLFFHLAL